MCDDTHVQAAGLACCNPTPDPIVLHWSVRALALLAGLLLWLLIAVLLAPPVAHWLARLREVLP